VVEATGSPEGLRAALAATLPRGTLVLKSTAAGSHGPNLAPLVVDEITLVGSRCGPFPPALRALETGAVDARSLVSERFPLARADQALRRAAEPGVLKVLIEAAG
jgi:threonine dehydrogenase-like Zn-dependent dehydrogenase